MRYVSRFLSIYGTRLILPTPVTANQVSFAMIAAGIVASLFFLSPSKVVFFFAAIFLQCWYLLDCMDGEVARYRHFQKTGSIIMDKRESSLTGMYYDIINHYIVNLLVPSMIGMGLFYQYHQPLFALEGIFAGLGQALLLAMHDGKSRTILKQLQKFRQIQVLSAAPASEKGNGTPRRSLGHRFFMALHYLMTYPSVMNLVFLTALFNFIGPTIDWRIPLLHFLLVGSLMVSVTIISRNIALQITESELRRDFSTSD